MKRFSMAMTWLALAGLMTMVSCRKPVVGFTNGEARTVTVSAVTENSGGSKTAIEGLKVNWSKGDQIRMNAESVLTLEDECAGSTMGRFTGEVKGDGPYYIGYPADNTTCAGATVKLSIQAEWTYDDEKQIVPMVAYAANVDDDVYFRNAVNMLKLQLKGDGTDASKLTSIELTSTTSNLSGDIEVKFSNGIPTFDAIADGAKTMTVSFGEEGLQLKADEVKCVYIPLARISGGDLTVRFICANGKYMEKNVTVDANFNGVNNMLSAPELMMGHETVNFGTPNLNWSVCNLGVDPEDLDAAEDWYGDYYAWGATETWYSAGGQTSSPTWKEGYGDGYTWNHCPFTNGTYSDGNEKVFTKYVPTGKSEYWAEDGDPDNKLVLESSDDAARAAWGGDWRMPTSAEWEALYANNTFEWLAAGAESEKVSGFKAVAAGCLVVKGGKNSVELDPSVYMFLPAAGERYRANINNVGAYGSYWLTAIDSDIVVSAMYVDFGKEHFTTDNYYSRFYGMTVRPVRTAR